MKLGILKLSVLLGGLFVVAQVARADSNCGNYSGAMLLECCEYDPQIGINPYTDPPCEGVFTDGEVSGVYGAPVQSVTCWDGSTADSEADCPAEPVTSAPASSTGVTCPDGITQADSLADCPDDLSALAAMGLSGEGCKISEVRTQYCPTIKSCCYRTTILQTCPNGTGSICQFTNGVCPAPTPNSCSSL